jgi:hypothetical protein
MKKLFSEKTFTQQLFCQPSGQQLEKGLKK